VEVPSLGVFDHVEALPLPGLGELESYPNGDSIRFIAEYGLGKPATMIRGTLRWPGWCETWAALGRLGYLDETPGRALGPTYTDEMRRAVNGSSSTHPRRAAAEHLGLPEDHAILDRLHWLGLFSNESIPEPAHSRADLLVHRMDASMQYDANERDMLVMDHVVEFRDAKGAPHRRRSSLVEYGVPGGDSAMSRTVGIPAACATRRILDGTIRDLGVQIPVIPSIYEPILADLETFGIREHVEDAGS
jgi:saccharopine dehydrogenase-like NADP-dependent oxidoreductase